jgi:hypothetical protein
MPAEAGFQLSPYPLFSPHFKLSPGARKEEDASHLIAGQRPAHPGCPRTQDSGYRMRARGPRTQDVHAPRIRGTACGPEARAPRMSTHPGFGVPHAGQRPAHPGCPRTQDVRAPGASSGYRYCFIVRSRRRPEIENAENLWIRYRYR